MFKPKNENERVVHRLKITKGHLEKVIKMVEEGEYCIDILHQSQAVQRALKEADNVLLESHLKTCVVDAMKNGRKEEAVKEVMNIFRARPEIG